MFDVSEITYTPEISAYFQEIDDALLVLNNSRPFPQETVSKIRNAFLPDRITATLNIEGIAVTRRQTLAMMDAMALNSNSSKNENELLNALNADALVYEDAMAEEPLREVFIKEINATLLKNIEQNTGNYRKKSVSITGANFQPPESLDVPPLMAQLVEKFNHSTAPHPIVKAAWLHATFTNIHPFEDGNGRTGRMLQDYALLSAKYFPTGIPSRLRDDYYDALEKADDNDWSDLLQLICEEQLSIISKVQGIISEIKNRGNWIRSIAKQASAQKEGTKHKQYLVWRQKMSNFLNEAAAVAEELSSESPEIDISSELHGPINFEKWCKISSDGSAPQTWALTQIWKFDGVPKYRSLFYFGRHHFRVEDPYDRDKLFGNVCLRLTAVPAGTEERFDFSDFIDGEIDFRQLSFVDGRPLVFSGTGDFKTAGRNRKSYEVWSPSFPTSTNNIYRNLLLQILRCKCGLDI